MQSHVQCYGQPPNIYIKTPNSYPPDKLKPFHAGSYNTAPDHLGALTKSNNAGKFSFTFLPKIMEERQSYRISHGEQHRSISMQRAGTPGYPTTNTGAVAGLNRLSSRCTQRRTMTYRNTATTTSKYVDTRGYKRAPSLVADVSSSSVAQQKTDSFDVIQFYNSCCCCGGKTRQPSGASQWNADDGPPMCRDCGVHDIINSRSVAADEVQRVVDVFQKHFELTFPKNLMFLTTAMNCRILSKTGEHARGISKSFMPHDMESHKCPSAYSNHQDRLKLSLSNVREIIRLAEIADTLPSMKIKECIPITLVPMKRFETTSAKPRVQMACCLCRRSEKLREMTAAAFTKQTLEMERWIHEIQVVNHLPRELFSSFVAHELLHAYFWVHRVSGSKIKPMRLEVEEGLCNAMSYFYLKKLVRHKRKELSAALKLQIQSYSQVDDNCEGEAPHTARQLRRPRATERIHRLAWSIKICDYRCTKLMRREGPEFHQAVRTVTKIGWVRTIQYVKKTLELPA